MKNFLVRVDANKTIGTGHFMRCLALIEEFSRSKIHTILITETTHPFFISKSRSLEVEIVFIEKSYPNPADKELVNNIISERKIEWLIIDGYQFTDDYFKDFEVKILIFSDFPHLEKYPGSIILNQNTKEFDNLYLQRTSAKILSGTEFVIIRDEFIFSNLKKKKVEKSVKNLLITVGGTDNENIIQKLLQVLFEFNSNPFNIKVIVGSENTNLEELVRFEKQNNTNHNVEFLHDSPKMPELIYWADLIITASGTTIWEICYIGTPFIYLKMASNQQTIINYLQNSKIGYYIGESSNLNNQILKDCFYEIVTNLNTRKKFSTEEKRILDGLGKKRVTEFLLKE